jgi:hypothetical protein
MITCCRIPDCSSNPKGSIIQKAPLALSAGTIPLLLMREQRRGYIVRYLKHQIAGFIKGKHGMRPVSKGITLQDPIPQTCHE